MDLFAFRRVALTFATSREAADRLMDRWPRKTLRKMLAAKPDSAAPTVDPPPLKIFVFLWRSLDATKYAAESAAGRSSDRSPYGYHHAADEAGVSVDFSRSRAEGGLARYIRQGLAAIVGFDLLHLLHNLEAASAADVIWCHTEREALAMTFWFRILRPSSKPKLLLQCVWLMDSWPNVPALRRWAYRRCLRHSDVLTFLSELNAEAAGILKAPAARWVPFGISVETFPLVAPDARPPRFPGTPIRILSLGNDVHRDWGILIEAFGGDARFTVHVGSSTFPVAELTRRGISNFKVGSSSQISELLALYAGSDLVVLPLRPNLHASGITVVLEAVTQGVPVVASDTGGLDGYFEGDEIAFVAPGDAAALRERCLALADNLPVARAQARKAQAKFLSRDYSSRGYALRQLALSRSLL